MSRIAVRLVVVLLLTVAVVASIVAIQKMLPTKQRYPIAQVDPPLAPETPAPVVAAATAQARNAILFIADGMGSAHIEAARLTSAGWSGRLDMQKLPVRGSVTTRSANDVVTDSAAAATAIATGFKTDNGRIAVDPQGRKLRTILEAAESAGFVTGLVTTFDASDATPAAFGAHASSRDDRDSIASQLAAANIEIVMGSSAKHFIPVSRWGGRRTDGVDLLAEAEASGTVVARDLRSLRAANSLPVIGVFDENERPPLPDLVHESIRLFEASGRRFFLMVESEEVDSAAHDHDLGRTLSAVREFDQAVKVAAEWARRDGTTVIVVTSDHDTAGMQMIPSDSPKLLQVIWSTTEHTAQDVPLYAFGPGSESFAGFLDNTVIAPALARLLGIESELRRAP